MLYTKITSMMMKITLSKTVILLWLIYPIVQLSCNFFIGLTYATTLIYLQVSSIQFLVYKNKYWRTFVFGMIVNLFIIFGLWNQTVAVVFLILWLGLIAYLVDYKNLYNMLLSIGVELSGTEFAGFPYLIWRKYGLLKEQIALYEKDL